MISSIIELVVFLVIITIFASLVSYGLTLRVKINKLNSVILQEIADKVALSDTLNRVMREAAKQKAEESDGFIKFLSESRDSAFKYIEDVQEGLASFIKDVGPIINAYRAMPVKNATTEKLVGAYDELVKLMPEMPKDS